MTRDGGDDATACPACGTRADADDRFCSACGTELAETGPRSPAAQETAAADDWDDGTTPDDGTTAETAATDDETASEADGGGDSTATDDGWDETSPSAEEQALESWQKRCPECGSVLVAQAVRCTGCGARQPDADGHGPADSSEPDDGTGEEGGADRRRDTADRGSDGRGAGPRRREADTGNYRERTRRESRDDGRQGRDRRAPPREGGDRPTDAGGGEVQYERERRAAAGYEQEARHEPAGGYRERRRRDRRGREREPPRRDRPRGEPPRREPARHDSSERDRRERLAERQAARQATGETPYEPTVPSSRWWAGVLVPAVLTFLGAAVGVAADPTALASGTVPWIGDGGGLLELGVVLTPTLAPFALYFDRRYVAHQTGRTPSAAYFLVAVPYLNLVVTGLYLWWRQQWLADA